MSVVPARPLTPPVRSLRLLPAPESDPPYDDDPRARPVLRLVTTVPPPVAPTRASAITVARRGGLQPVVDQRDLAATPAAALPESRPFAHALVQRLLEVCAGVRPLTQLRHDTTPDLYEKIEGVLAARPRPGATRPTRRDVRSVHVQESPEGTAEVCATVLRYGRAGALALRLETRRGRWLCTELLGL